MKSIIPYGKQHITEQDIKAVTDVLKADFLTQGPEIEKFEQAFANYVGSRYAVAVANGTAALHLCALALNVNEQSRVITTPITFSASANCVRYCGGDVDFVDIDPHTYLINISDIQEKLEAAPKNTYSGIVAVDFAGRAVNLEKLRDLAEEHDLWIIEDACHAPGGFFVDSNGKKQHCGNGAYADLAIFSFHPVKHIAAGEGGMITTNNQSIYQRLRKLRTHGITKNSKDYTNTTDEALGFFGEQSEVETRHINPNSSHEDYPNWYMEMQELGYNYRLTDIQAALAKSQLSRADDGLRRRREIAARYNKAFESKDYIIRQSGLVNGHAYHLYVVEVEDRKGLYDYLRSYNIFTQIHYFPVHLMPYYRKDGWSVGDFPSAEQYYSGCLSLPIFPSLTNSEQDFVIVCMGKFYE